MADPVTIGFVVASIALQVGLSFANKAKSSTVGKIAEFRLQKTDFGADVLSFDGRFRLAGANTWAGPVKEFVKDSSAGKGFSSPKQFEYRYTQSSQHVIAFTDPVGIGAFIKVFMGSDQQPIFDATAEEGAIARIDGDRVVTDNMSFYFGETGQPPDPTMIAAEGAANVNALERVAYIVMKDYPRDQQMPGLSVICSQNPLTNTFPKTPVNTPEDHRGYISVLSGDRHFAVVKNLDRLVVYNMVARLVQTNVAIPDGDADTPPALTAGNDAIWIDDRRGLGSGLYTLYLRKWPSFAASSQVTTILSGSAFGTPTHGLSGLTTFSPVGVAQSVVLAATNTILSLVFVDPDNLLPFQPRISWTYADIFPNGTINQFNLPIANNGEDIFYPVSANSALTHVQITTIDVFPGRVVAQVFVALNRVLDWEIKAVLHACYEPVTGSILMLARESGTNKGLVFRYDLGTDTLETLVLSAGVSMIESAACWNQGPNGDNKIYALVDDVPEEQVYEIDAVDLTEDRIIDLGSWAASAGQGLLYDQNSHALLAFETSSRDFALLDRVNDTSGDAVTADVITRRHGHTGKLIPSQLDVSGLSGGYTGSALRAGQTIASYLAAIQELIGFEVMESQAGGVGKVFFFDRGGPVDATIPFEDLAARPAGSRRPEPLAFQDSSDNDLPAALELSAPEAAIDFNDGGSIERRSPETFDGRDRKSLSSSQVALTAAARGAAVERLLYESHATQTPLDLALTAKWSWLRPGHRVNVVGRTATFRAVLLDGQRGTGGVIRFKARTEAIEAFDTTDLAPVLLGDRTRKVPQLQPLAVALVDAPAPTDSLVNPQGPPTLFVVASRFAEVGRFLGAPVLKKQSDGTLIEVARIGPQGEAAAYGFLKAALPAVEVPTIPDDTNLLHIQLYRGTIASAPLSEVLPSLTKNLALIRSSDGAWEWMKFTTMALQGDGTWLSTGALLRDVRNTRNHMAHDAGAEVWIFSGAEGAQVSYNQTTELGTQLVFKVPPLGLEPSLLAELSVTPIGRSIMPWSPDPVVGTRLGNNDWTFDFHWRPITGSGETLGAIPNELSQFHFKVRFYDTPGVGGTVLATYDSVNDAAKFTFPADSQPQVFLLDAATQAADFGANQQILHYAITQLGENDIEGEPAVGTVDASLPMNIVQEANTLSLDAAAVTLANGATAGNWLFAMHGMVTDDVVSSHTATGGWTKLYTRMDPEGENGIAFWALQAAGGETDFTFNSNTGRVDEAHSATVWEVDGSAGTAATIAELIQGQDSALQDGGVPSINLSVTPIQANGIYFGMGQTAINGTFSNPPLSTSWSGGYPTNNQGWLNPGDFDDAGGFSDTFRAITDGQKRDTTWSTNRNTAGEGNTAMLVLIR